MLKTYFCKQVLGFSLNLDQTITEQFSGLPISIIIYIKKLFFTLVSNNGVIYQRGVAKHTQKPIKPIRNLKTLRNLVKTCVR